MLSFLGILDFVLLFPFLLVCGVNSQRIPVVSVAITTSPPPPPHLLRDEVDKPTTKRPTNETLLKLQACCGTNCVTFDTLMSMVGVQCCGDTPINFFDKICCGDSKHYERRSGSKFFDRCCGDKPYSYDQTCCKGKVYDGAAQSCCGDNPYHSYDRTVVCCAEKLIRVPDNATSPSCCGESVYDASGKTQFCCGGQVYRRNGNHECCVKHDSTDSTLSSEAEGYMPSQQLCCDGVHDLKVYDTCCYVSDTKQKHWMPPKQFPYNSSTKCCDLTGVRQLEPKTGDCV